METEKFIRRFLSALKTRGFSDFSPENILYVKLEDNFIPKGHLKVKIKNEIWNFTADSVKIENLVDIFADRVLRRLVP